MKGFAPLPVRGDGFSKKKSLEVLRTDPRFKYETPEEHAKGQRDYNQEHWHNNVRHSDSLTKEMLFCGPEKRHTNTVIQTSPEGEKLRMQLWRNGYWSSALLSEPGYQGKKYDWQVSCIIGGTYSISPGAIRMRIVNDLGEEAYDRFKQRQWDDLESLKWCLNQMCKELAHKNGIALSWITSPSSERLIRRLGIRVEREWAFLFPHYSF